jgi:hypothetical protein
MVVKKIGFIFFLINCIYTMYSNNDTIVDSKHNWIHLKKNMESNYIKKISNKDLSQFNYYFNQQTLFNVNYWGYDGKIHKGQIFCNLFISNELKKIFNELFHLKFPIYSVKPISDFNFNDNISMESNNTTCFDFRQKTLKNGFSKHAYGLAIDLNPRQNPFVTLYKTFPLNYNSKDQKGRIRLQDEMGLKVIHIFRKYGWQWGGNWNNNKDYMHFEK